MTTPTRRAPAHRYLPHVVIGSPHLTWPQCRCGWKAPGPVWRQAARTYWKAHRDSTEGTT